MSEITLQDLATRLEVVEKKLANLTSVQLPSRGWKSVVGISEQNDFTRDMYAEMQARREEERTAARAEVGE